MLFRLVGGVLKWSANHVNINQDTLLGKKEAYLVEEIGTFKLQGHRFAQWFFCDAIQFCYIHSFQYKKA